MKVLCKFHSWGRKFQGTKVPPMELSFLGTKVPWYESSIIHFRLLCYCSDCLLCSCSCPLEMPVTEEVNDDAAGSGDHAQSSANSASSSALSRLMVCIAVLVNLVCMNSNVVVIVIQRCPKTDTHFTVSWRV